MGKDYWTEIIKITDKYDPEIHYEGELIDYLADLYPRSMVKALISIGP